MDSFHKHKFGQSLIEVIVAVGVMALMLTTIAALVSLSVKNSRIAKDRAQAISFAQEGVELMRTYRDFNLTDLTAKAVVGNSWDLMEGWTIHTGFIDCVSGNIPGGFTRCVTLGPNVAGSGIVDVNVEVSWTEGSQTYKTNQITQLTLWQR